MKTIGVFVGAFSYFAICFILLMLIGLVYVLPIVLYAWVRTRLTYVTDDGSEQWRPWAPILLAALLGVALALVCLCTINLVACGHVFASAGACVLDQIPS